LYPQRNGRASSQLWQSKKLLEDIPDQLLTPMVRLTATRHFYVDEIARLLDGHYFYPKRWIQDFSGDIIGVGYSVTLI